MCVFFCVITSAGSWEPGGGGVGERRGGVFLAETSRARSTHLTHRCTHARSYDGRSVHFVHEHVPFRLLDLDGGVFGQPTRPCIWVEGDKEEGGGGGLPELFSVDGILTKVCTLENNDCLRHEVWAVKRADRPPLRFYFDWFAAVRNKRREM